MLESKSLPKVDSGADSKIVIASATKNEYEHESSKHKSIMSVDEFLGMYSLDTRITITETSEPKDPSVPDPDATTTIESIPPEIHAMIIGNLDRVSSTCYALAYKKVYPLHWATNGAVQLRESLPMSPNSNLGGSFHNTASLAHRRKLLGFLLASWCGPALTWDLMVCSNHFMNSALYDRVIARFLRIYCPELREKALMKGVVGASGNILWSVSGAKIFAHMAKWSIKGEQGREAQRLQ